MLNAQPGPIALLPPVRRVAIGQGYMLAITRDGGLRAWGSNTAGQLGLGHLRTVTAPALVPLRARIEAVAAGATHALAVSRAGTIRLGAAIIADSSASARQPIRRRRLRSTCPNASRRWLPACTFRSLSRFPAMSMPGAGTDSANWARTIPRTVAPAGPHSRPVRRALDRGRTHACGGRGPRSSLRLGQQCVRPDRRRRWPANTAVFLPCDLLKRGPDDPTRG
ncbi:MAG: hypothetical protein IPO58_24205 [Betaproteobacteria bacterium]|nr:hypothetical protein [Betaproteobacteria bacterium]